MYANIVLTKDLPVVDVGARKIQLGEVADCIFIVPSFDHPVVVGALIEAAFEIEEVGVHELELSGIDCRSGAEHVIANHVHEVFPPDDDWMIPLMLTLTFPIQATIKGDADFLFQVSIDRQLYAERGVVVRSFAVQPTGP